MLVIGSTGKTGRRVAAKLTALGVNVRSGSRSADIPFDWNRKGTWAPALAGSRATYITYYPDLAFPGVSGLIAEFCELAVASGVRRLVLLSGRGEEGARASETAVQNSGAEWTVLRCNWFNQNFDESFFLEPVLGGQIAIPAGNAVEPFVDVNDIADAAVAALTGDGHQGGVRAERPAPAQLQRRRGRIESGNGEDDHLRTGQPGGVCGRAGRRRFARRLCGAVLSHP